MICSLTLLQRAELIATRRGFTVGSAKWTEVRDFALEHLVEVHQVAMANAGVDAAIAQLNAAVTRRAVPVLRLKGAA